MGETKILVEKQPPQGIFVCDHAGRVINKFSFDIRLEWSENSWSQTQEGGKLLVRRPQAFRSRSFRARLALSGFSRSLRPRVAGPLEDPPSIKYREDTVLKV